jgi:hypothetical protein
VSTEELCASRPTECRFILESTHPQPVLLVNKAEILGSCPAQWLTTMMVARQFHFRAASRVVFNIAYLWPNQVVAFAMGVNVLPEHVTELVIHFKKGHGDRARMLIGNNTEDEDYPEWTEDFALNSALRALQPGECCTIVPTPTPLEGHDFFDLLAYVYANTVVGKTNTRVHRLKLTLVGLDEFDRVRDLEAADDDKFPSRLEERKRLGMNDDPIPRSDWESPPPHGRLRHVPRPRQVARPQVQACRHRQERQAHDVERVLQPAFGEAPRGGGGLVVSYPAL